MCTQILAWSAPMNDVTTSDLAYSRIRTWLPANSPSWIVRWWRPSLVRILGCECGRFLIRILVILRNPMLRAGAYQLPLSPRPEDDPRDLCQPNSFLRACIQHIQQQKLAHPWAGPLDLQTIAQTFQMGAQWGRGNADTKTESEVHRLSVRAKRCRSSRKWNSKPIGREAMEAVMGDARQFVQSSTPVGKPIYLKRPKRWLAADNTLHALDCKCLMCKPPK